MRPTLIFAVQQKAYISEFIVVHVMQRECGLTLRSAAGEALCLKAFLENAVRLSRLLEWIVMRTHAGY